MQVSAEAICRGVDAALQLPLSERQRLGRAARASYVKERQEFEDNVQQLMQLLVEISSSSGGSGSDDGVTHSYLLNAFKIALATVLFSFALCLMQAHNNGDYMHLA